MACKEGIYVLRLFPSVNIFMIWINKHIYDLKCLTVHRCLKNEFRGFQISVKIRLQN